MVEGLLDAIDPAWFYSSLAQASAAIVGLVGAVLGSRIVDHIALMRGERRKLDESIGDIRRHFDSRIDNLQAVERNWEENRTSDVEALQQGQTVRHLRYEFTAWNGSAATGSATVPDVRNHLTEVERRLELLRLILTAYSRLVGNIKEDEVTAYVDRLQHIASHIPEEPKQIVLMDAKMLDEIIEPISRFRPRLVPISFVIVFLLLAWIALTGIIWPLSALPGLPDAYPKHWMLRALGAGLLGLIGYFSYQFRELRQLGRLHW